MRGGDRSTEPGRLGPSSRRRLDAVCSASSIVLVRHTETEWSRDGRHTGRTDIPLTGRGREIAARLARRLADRSFAKVLVSPLRRARETCELCGLSSQAQVRDELAEWDYGDYEGMTTEEITRRMPGWTLWGDGCPGGEDAEQVGARARKVIDELASVQGEAAVFSHGHMLRVLAACWIELEPARGARLPLSTGAVSTLGFEHGVRTLDRWNVSAAGDERTGVVQ